MNNDSISNRLLVLEANGRYIPVFEGNKESMIYIRQTNSAAMLNKAIRDEMVEVAKKNYISKLKPLHRFRPRMFLRFIKNYDTLCFTKEGEDVAFYPKCNSLNFMLEFCYTFNCLDVLKDSIDIVGKQLISYPNRNISADALYTIRYKKEDDKLSFIWLGNWAENL